MDSHAQSWYEIALKELTLEKAVNIWVAQCRPGPRTCPLLRALQRPTNSSKGTRGGTDARKRSEVTHRSVL